MTITNTGQGDPVPDADPPLEGVRVVEIGSGDAVQIAGMMLADLGARVTRFAAPGPAPARAPEAPSWDRGKTVVLAPPAESRRAATGADVLLVDHGPRALAAAGLRAVDLAGSGPGAVHVWMPPYGQDGEWSELPPDPFLLEALSGVAGRSPTSDGGPVIPLTPLTTYLHGSMAAAAAVAGLVGRARQGRSQSVVVSGLHAAAAQLTTVQVQGLDQPVFSPSRRVTGLAFFRAYQAGDGEWFHLASLTFELFLRALEALDRLDLLALPEVLGDWNNILLPDAGGDIIAAELEKEFARADRAHWLELFRGADVPCAPVQTWREWAAGEIAAANQAFVRREHPLLGTVTMPRLPITLSRAAVTAGGFATGGDPEAAGGQPAEPRVDPPPAADGGEPSTMPLAGVRVLDVASFLAAPFVGSLLADFGADVIKVEPLAGDPYRTYAISYLAAHQRKRTLALDVAHPHGTEVLLGLLENADVLVENFRPSSKRKLGFFDGLLERYPRLVQCSVSAYGGAQAQAPGFDPVFQALSGLSRGQGGDDRPVTLSIPVHDTATGVLGALGALAALYHRARSGSGQEVSLSLAGTASFVQTPALVDYPGRAERPKGGPDFRGHEWSTYCYQCQDGWVAVAARDDASQKALLASLSVTDPADVGPALASMPASSALASLRAHDVPACPVTEGPQALDAPYLVANGFSHVLTHHEFGRVQVGAGLSTWGADTGPAAPRAARVGEHTREVLREVGYPPGEIDALVAAGVVAVPAARDGS